MFWPFRFLWREEQRGGIGIPDMVLIGDRGMITSARMREDLPASQGIQWISALRATQIQKLAAGGQLQMSLFDQTDLVEIAQPRVRAEAEAIEQIMRLVREGAAIWVGSAVLKMEVRGNPDPDRRRESEALMLFIAETVIPMSTDADRARNIEKLGFSPFDALHLASAERGRADVLLTTDEI
jgi:hypothetical protein